MKLNWLMGCSAAVLLAGAAHAQEPVEADTIVVTATGRTSAPSSTKTETPLIETPQSISVITREEMDVRAVQTVADALSYSAGVQAEAAGIDSRVDEVSVRGFGAGGFSSNNNFVDGLRLPAGGQWTRPAFDPFGLQQAEVLKGPSSVLYGQVAPGGIVNLVTKRPSLSASNELLLQSAGYTDLGRWQHQVGLDFNANLSGDGAALFRLVTLLRDGETQIDETENSRFYFSPSLAFEIGDATRLTLLAQYQLDEGGSTYQFLPALGTLHASNVQRIASDAFIGEPGWNTFDREQYSVAAFVEHDFTSWLTGRVNARYSHIDSLYRATVLGGNTLTACGVIAGCIPGATVNRRAVQGDGETDGWAFDAQLQAEFNTGPVAHTLLVGADHFDTEWDHYRYNVAPALVLPVLNIFDPVARGSAGFGASLTPAVFGASQSEQSGVYIQDQMSIGNWRIAIGGRQDQAAEDATNLINSAVTRTRDDAFTWRAGAVYLFDNGLAPYASYSESFLPSPGAAFDGTPFEPTTGEQYEIGLRYQPPGSNIFLTLSLYEITQQNVTTPDPDLTHVCGGGRCSVQTGEGVIRGAEFEARASLANGVSIIGTATAVDSEISSTNTAADLGNQLPQLPESMASLFVDYRVPEGALSGLGFGGGVRYVGESYGNTANTLAIPDYTLFDLFARYDLSNLGADGVILSLNARNVADETYVATCNTVQSCYYGSGRTVSARLQYRW